MCYIALFRVSGGGNEGGSKTMTTCVCTSMTPIGEGNWSRLHDSI